MSCARVTWQTVSGDSAGDNRQCRLLNLDDNDEPSKETNKCVLLWEVSNDEGDRLVDAVFVSCQGMVKDRSFSEMKYKACPTENFAREHFRRHGVEHYWDIGHNDAVLDSSLD